MDFERDENYVIENCVVSVWEGQHPYEDSTCWKWSITEMTEGDVIAKGFCDFKEDTIHAVLMWFTHRALRGMTETQREEAETFYHGLKMHRPGAPVPPDDF